jgi:hypothetical protein
MKNFERVKATNRSVPVHRNGAPEGKITPEDGIFEEFLLGNKVKEGLEGETHQGNIGPVLVFGKNNHGSVVKKSALRFDLNPIEDGQNPPSNLPGNAVDEGTSFHTESHNAKCQNPKFRSMSNFKYERG